jgi:hypothetical protein
MANIHFIGGEKGGVGKSLVSRVLAQYMIDKGIPFLGFDTDRSHGALLRFYTDYASPMLLDGYENLDAMIEAAVEKPEERILVDLAAQTYDALSRWMEESGLPEMVGEVGLKLTYWHVMDSGKDSVDLLTKLFAHFGSRLNYVIVLNQLRGDEFEIFNASAAKEQAQELGARVITIKKLQDSVMNKIDAASSSFWAAGNRTPMVPHPLGIMERQRVRIWLESAFAQIDSVGV